MKSLSKLALCLLLAMSLTVSAFAAQVPDSLVAENLNGQQRLVKTYTLSPEVDPDELKEEDFSYDGYLYTWAYTTKVEHPYLESKTVTETVTVNTAKNDLAQILAELSPSMPYEKAASPASWRWIIPRFPQRRPATPPNTAKPPRRR